MFKGTDIIDFFDKFSTKEDCLEYLANEKWSEGFICKKCENTSWCKTPKPFVRKCNSCKHKESATAGTLFHKVKFSITKAFYMVFIMSTSKKSCSSEEFARKLSLQEKTSWLFQHKVRQAMKSSEKYPIKTKVVVDEFVWGEKEKGKQGRSKGKKKETVMAIEYNGFGILRCYCKVIKNAGTKELRPFLEKHIAPKAEIKTDKWRGYTPLIKDFPNLTQIKSDNGKNFPLIHRQIMMFKAWLRGIHHHCMHLQNYLDEFCYRFNRLRHMDTIFNNLIARMVKSKPAPLKLLRINWGI